MRLIVKILYSKFLVSIINKTALILAIFKYNLKILRFIIFKLDLKKVKVKAVNIWENLDLSNLKMVTKLDFDK